MNRSRASSTSSSPKPLPPTTTNQPPPKKVSDESENNPSGDASGDWNLGLRSFELPEIRIDCESGDDSSSKDSVSRSQSPDVKPSLKTKAKFDPARHVKLDEHGLHPDVKAIYQDPLFKNERQRQEAVSCAKQYIKTKPTVMPLGFRPDRHVRPRDGRWEPAIEAIRFDHRLNDVEKREVYRQAMVYVPHTGTDPEHRLQNATRGSGLLITLGLIGFGVYAIATSNRQHGSSCDLQPMNRTEAEALVESLREEFPQLVNATLENMDDWYLTIKANLTEPIYRDRDGNILEEVCRSAAQTLNPVLALMVMFSLMAMQMLLQG